MPTGLNPVPTSPKIVNPDGSPTQEFYWFLLTLFNVSQQGESAQLFQVFANQPVSITDAPAFQAAEKQATFVQPSSSIVSALQVQFASIRKALAFGQQTSNALDRIASLERALAFRPQPPPAPTPQIIICTQGTFPVLSVANAGALVLVTDFGHIIYWDGTTAVFADEGNDFIAGFETAPNGPVNAWVLCNGIATTKLNADGTTSAVTPPDYTTASYLKFGTSSAIGPTAASGTSADTDIGVTSRNDVAVTGAATAVQSIATALHHHAPGTLELQRTQLTAYYRR